MPRVIPAGNKTDPWELMKLHITETNKDTSQMRRQRVEGEQLNQRLNMQERLQSERLDRGDARATMLEEGRDRRHSERLDAQAGRASAAMSGNKGIQAFVDTVREKGYNNPYALAAIAAHVQAESRGHFGNRTGDNGHSRGGLQWYKERGDNLDAFAAKSGRRWDDPVTQAMFWLQEGPSYHGEGNFERLMNAKSLREANDAMSDIQRFNEKKLPNERANRLRIAEGYASKWSGIAKPTATERADNERNERVANVLGPDAITDQPGIFRDENGRRYQVANYKPDIVRKQMKEVARPLVQAGDPRGTTAANDYIVLDRNIPLDKKTGAPGYRVYIDPPNTNNTIAQKGEGGTPAAASVVVPPANDGVKGTIVAPPIPVTRVTAEAMPDDIEHDVSIEEEEDEE